MSFPLIGNAGVRGAVMSCIARDQMPHAVLIHGEEGVGKHTLAAYLEAAAVCTGEHKPCGICKGCHLAQGGNHPDLLTVSREQGKKFISVSQIRALHADAVIKPHLANRKVYRIDGADSMNEQAQNAFLKLLEEPPAGVMFLLIAQSRPALLDTVLSRCVSFGLAAPETQEAVAWLTERGHAADEARQALYRCAGRIGGALELLEGGGKAEEQADAERYIQTLLDGRTFELLTITAGYEKARPKAELFMKQLRIALAGEIRESRGRAVRLRGLLQFYDALSEYEESLKTNINLPLLFTAMACRAEQIFHS